MQTTTTSDRKFGLTVGAAFLVLSGITWWRGHLGVRNVFVVVGTLLILGGAFAPALLGPVHRGWMAMAHAISKVTTPIFMGIAYYCAVVPIGLLMRALGKNPIAPVEHEASFWFDRRVDNNLKSDMTRQF